MMKLPYLMASAYLRAGRPLLPLTRWLRCPLRFLFHITPTLAHDKVHRWKPYLIRWSHQLLVGDLPSDFRINNGELVFRSTGTEMAVHGYYVGEIEAHLMRWIKARLRPGFIMLDIGAHHGAFSLVVAHELRKRGWGGKVHAYEPDRRNFELLCHNVRQNKLENYVQLSQMAVSSKDGRMAFLSNIDENSDNKLAIESESTAFLDDASARRIREEVETVSLDTIGLQIGNVDLIKMDTQGAELDVLRGGKGMLAKFKPALLLELLAEGGDRSALEDLLECHSYTLYGITRNGNICEWGHANSYVSWDCCCLQNEREHVRGS